MSRHWRVLFAVVLLAAVPLTGCASEVSGTATPAESGTTTNAPDAGSAPADPPAPALAGPGQCVDGNDLTPLDCAQPHTVEITKAGTFGADLPAEPPDRAAVFAAAFPQCREAAAMFLGNTNYDATTLGAWLLWAGADEWKSGNRWYRCGVAQLSVAGEAESRTGSVRNILAGDGLYEFQICSSVRPSEELPQRVACTGAHTGEAIGAVRMGTPDQPFPSQQQFDATAAPACRAALREYLGATRDDVAASWRWPDEANWKHGFNNITCYAETAQPVTTPLRGIGTSPLPR
ncbi:septum formation family protein [Saccharomonospora sp. NPDC046836]|uniref:septum formation family protein n=1 Tax=Saccharomonospora sp. NPDC046836 TaxID=3156921 RepID=UPI0033F230BC